MLTILKEQKRIMTILKVINNKAKKQSLPLFGLEFHILLRFYFLN